MSSTATASFEKALAGWHGLVGRPAGTPAELVRHLEDLYKAIYTTDFAAFQVAEVDQIAHAAIDDLFDLALSLRDRVPEWKAQGLMVQGAPLAVRNAIRVLRYTCDIVGEVAHDYPRLQAGEHTYKGFEGPPDWTSMHPALEVGARPQFRSGDVLLVRGQVHNSAAIARIGDVDSQFSHVGLVHVDANREPWLVEALIEDGASITPLAKALGHDLVRAVLFRHRDRRVAEEASRWMHEHVRAVNSKFGGWIPYDFSMRLDGYDELFCSKLVRQAYEQSTGGRLLLPTFSTQLAMKNRDFLDRIGATAVETFAPADFEVEPSFDVVAEWRDYRMTPRVRMQDLIMSKLFDWMDQYGYVFADDAAIRGIEVLGGISGAMPTFVKNAISGLVPKVPSNMSRRTIGAIAMLHKTAEPILERLSSAADRHIRETGRPLHPREVQDDLEAMRAAAPQRIGYLVLP